MNKIIFIKQIKYIKYIFEKNNVKKKLTPYFLVKSCKIISTTYPIKLIIINLSKITISLLLTLGLDLYIMTSKNINANPVHK